MAKRTMKLLPFVQLTPTVRHQGSFQCVDACVHEDFEDQVLMTFYCHGMDVAVALDRASAETALKRLQEALDGNR